jgi:hypothetical protein
MKLPTPLLAGSASAAVSASGSGSATEGAFADGATVGAFDLALDATETASASLGLSASRKTPSCHVKTRLCSSSA